MGQQARRHVQEEFSLDIISNKYVKVYENLLFNS